MIEVDDSYMNLLGEECSNDTQVGTERQEKNHQSTDNYLDQQAPQFFNVRIYLPGIIVSEILRYYSIAIEILKKTVNSYSKRVLSRYKNRFTGFIFVFDI